MVQRPPAIGHSELRVTKDARLWNVVLMNPTSEEAGTLGREAVRCGR